jgi:uncharacterized protein YjbI with pentapeptide repeats
VLCRARWDGANLALASFNSADLRRVSFRGAHLDSTDLSAADLRGADFTGAIIGEIDLRGAKLDGVTGLTEAQIPDGQKDGQMTRFATRTGNTYCRD